MNPRRPNYFSPVLIIEGASKGIVVGSFLTFALLFLSSLVLGRAFCGWVCPGAGVQEAFFQVQGKKHKGGKRDWVKYAIWIQVSGLRN
ncbi:MAG: 4Fe-4S binding protein [Candidatus Aquicultorales bacterium]